MDDSSKIIFGGVASLIGGFLSGWFNYYFQFKRNRRIEQKARLRILYNVIRETIDYTSHQLESFKEFVEKLDNDKTIVPLLAVPAHNSSKDLLDRIITDEYYTSYSEVMNDVIDSEAIFYEIKRHSIFIHNQVQELIRLVTEAVLKDQGRKKGYLDKYKNLHPFIDNLYKLNEKDMEPVLERITKQITLFTQAMVGNNDGTGGIEIINSIFIQPILEEAIQSANMHIQGFATDLGAISSAYNEIVFQNESIQKDIREDIEPLQHALDGLKKAFSVLSNNQVKQLFKGD